MMKTIPWAAAVILVVLASCNSGRHSPVGFRLPESGDVDRGRTAFVELQCHTCHRVVGDDQLPAPTADPAIPVALGGTLHEVRTDGYLVTSIIHPSHRLAGYPKDRVSVEGARMPDASYSMTVRQLIDITAYLQSRYKVVPPPHMYP